MRSSQRSNTRRPQVSLNKPSVLILAEPRRGQTSATVTRNSAAFKKQSPRTRRGLAGNKSSHLAWLNLGVVYARLENKEEATRCYQQAVALNPNFWGCWMKMGWAYDAVDNHEQAAKAYKRATELEPRNRQLWLLLHEQYEKLGLYDLSHEAWRRAKELS